MEDIVLIGKVTQSTPNTVEVEYPSIVGINAVRVPRTMVARFERISGGRVAVLVRTDETEKGKNLYQHIGIDQAPLHVTDEHMSIVSALEYNEPIPTGLTQDTEEESVMWGASAPVNNQPLITIANNDGTEEFVIANEAFDAMLFSGGRKKVESINWDFTPSRKPAFVMHEEGQSGTTVARVNDNAGKPVAYHIFNPTYANESRPAGAYLGTFSGSYYPMPYRDGYQPIMDMSAERGWPCQVIAWDEGKRSALFCDVTSSVDWDKATKGFAKKWSGLVNTGDYRIGIAVYNSLDGSSSFKVQAVAMRLTCSNGMFMGDSATLINLKHTVNTLGNYDFEKLAGRIMDVIETAAQEIVVTESMRDVEINRDTFEKLMTICEKKGLITKPVIKRDDTGNVSAVTRGHMWRLMGQGWPNPSEPWVAVDEQDTGSLYHVYNILTGAITHKPVWTDGATKLEGSKLNFSTLTDRLSKVHKICGDIATKSINGTPVEQQLEKVKMFSEILY